MTTVRRVQGKANPIPWDDDLDPEEELDEKAESANQSASAPDPTPSEIEPDLFSISAFLVDGEFEFSFTGLQSDTVSIMANNSHFALFIEDHKVGSLIDGFQRKITENSINSPSATDVTDLGRGKSVIKEPLLSKLRDKPERTKVILTEKNSRSNESAARALKYIFRLGTFMELSDLERKLIKPAGSVFGLLKHGGFKSPSSSQTSQSDTNLLKKLTSDPAIQSIIGLLYSNLESQVPQALVAHQKIANILTTVDLFMDNTESSEPITAGLYERLSIEYRQLTNKLLTKEVVDSFLAMIGDEVNVNPERRLFNRVLIYSDQARGLYALETRLKNEGFKITTIGTPEEFVAEHKLLPPNMIILHFSTNSTSVIRALHYFLIKGLAIGSVPAFVLVKGTVVGRLTALLDMGIEEILDLEAQLDILIHKMKKSRSAMETANNNDQSDISSRAISQGNLSHMGIIDLLQALGPSRRTTRITVTLQTDTGKSLVLYLNEGKIVHAVLNGLEGEDAVYAAMKWEDGSWKVEPMKSEEIPEPNISLANEAIMMEGCRLLDEQNRSDVTPASPA